MTFVTDLLANKENLNTHIKNVHEGQKNYKCDLCDKAFSQQQKLMRHIKNLHKGQKNYKCDLCDKDFSQQEISKN